MFCTHRGDEQLVSAQGLRHSLHTRQLGKARKGVEEQRLTIIGKGCRHPR